MIVETRGDRAEATIAEQQPDLVMLDIMLPGKDGMSICRDLRANWQGPIVLLTSLDSDMNHILALEMGAQDYILKTAPPAVLLARLRLHLRQSQQVQSEEAPAPTKNTRMLRFGSLTIDALNRQVVLFEENIALSTADFDLLWVLASHAGQILNRDALLKTLRGVSYDGMDRSIDVAISRLRKNCTTAQQSHSVSKPSATKAICLRRRPGTRVRYEKTFYSVLPAAVCLFSGDVADGRVGL